MSEEGNRLAVAPIATLKHPRPMPLDPETFKAEAGNIRWRFHTTERLGQFDIAIPSDDDFNPDPAALAHLQAALTRIDALYDAALREAEKGWAARYTATPRPRDDWSLVRLFADATGHLVLSLNESEIDTYNLWDVTLINDVPVQTVQRAWVAR